ncbi:hypothetical protein C2G38_2204883 [Gigaspora rosea]|uniref:Uncharacterized protein n=1 Tax=Gigaspora rosea TaxID=44941 RepID=A0A397UN29_9GLOM|nr:hypothetical protein C2G38_2204883 [Gigaspora rosea]
MFLEYVDSLQETESIFISVAVAEINTWDKLNALTEIEKDDSFFDRHLQLAMIFGSTQSQNLNSEITIDIEVVNRVLELSKLVN